MENLRLDFVSKPFVMIFSLMGFVLVIIGCQPESRQADFVVLSTNEVAIDGSTEKGVVFSANILLSKDEPILDNGFVYALTSKPTLGKDMKVIVNEVGGAKFSAIVVDALMPDTTYYVRSYVKTKNFLTYGNEVTFYSNGSKAPEIEKIEPTKAFWGDTIMITGHHFDRAGKNNSVWFGGFEASKRWGTNDTIYAIVPPEVNTKKSEVTVKLYGKTSANSKTFEIHSPVVTSISRTEGQHPDTVTIHGNYFSPIHGHLFIGDTPLQRVSVSKNMIKFKIPFLGESQTLPVRFVQLTEEYVVERNFRYNGQKILGLDADSMFVKDTLTIYAENIDFRKVDWMVNIDETLCNKGLRWQDSAQFIVALDYNSYGQTRFDLSCLVEDAVPRQLKEIFKKQIRHRKPFVSTVSNPELVCFGSLNLQGQGFYPGWGASDTWIKLESETGQMVDVSWGGINIRNSDQVEIKLPINVFPGNWKVHMRFMGRNANSVPFRVMKPEFLSFSSTGPFSRENINVKVLGNYFPVNIEGGVYKVLHLESGFRVPVSVDHWSENEITLYIGGLYGRGNYQAEIHLGKEIYTSPVVLRNEDVFKLVAPVAGYPNFGIYASFAFASKGKFYSIWNDSYWGATSIDLATGKIANLGTSFFPGDLDSFYPHLFKGEFYAIFNNGVYRFDGNAVAWVKEAFDFGDEMPRVLCTVNDELLAFSADGRVFAKSTQWAERQPLHTPTQWSPTFAHSLNGKIYFWELTNYSFTKYDLATRKFEREFPAPLYERRDLVLQHLFVYRNEICLCYQQRGLYHTECVRFNPVSDEYFIMNSVKLPSRGSDYKFAPDEHGNVYMYTNNIIYQFDPK